MTRKLDHPSQIEFRYTVEYENYLSSFIKIFRSYKGFVNERRTKGLAWLIFGYDSALPEQGWKIHVSLSLAEVVRKLPLILEYLKDKKVAFKLPNSLNGISFLNSGLAGVSQAGKIITIYPPSTEETFKLTSDLDSFIPVRTGPRVQSDKYLRKNGAISLRYGSFSLNQVLIDEFGRLEPAINTPLGLITDDRNVTGKQSQFASSIPFIFAEEDNSSEDNTDIIFKSASAKFMPLCLLQKTPRGNVYLAVNIDEAETLIIKTAEPGVMGDVFGNDAANRLINEFSVLTQLAKYNLNIAPKPIDINPDIPWLAMTDVEGETLESQTTEKQLAGLMEAASNLAILHDTGFVHRDIKLANIMTNSSGTFFIDWELASPINSNNPILGGTRGHTAPEVLQGRYAFEQANSKSDIFSMGASFAHVLLRYNPALLPLGSGRIIGLLTFTGYRQAIKIIRKCLSPDIKKRPTAVELTTDLRNFTLHQERKSIKGKILRRGSKKWALRFVNEVSDSTRNYQITTPSGYTWQNRHILADFLCEGINLGTSGIIIGLLTIAEFTGNNGYAKDIKSGAEWLLNSKPPEVSSGLFTGNAGVALALAIAGTRLNDPALIDASLQRLEIAARPRNEQDLFSGAAGVLWAGLAIGRVMGSNVAYDIVAPLGRWLCDTVINQDNILVWRNSGKLDSSKEPFTGAAHGAAGIALALNAWGKERRLKEGVLLARDVLLRLFYSGRVESGASLKRTLDSPSRLTLAGEWCHGSLGYGWCILQSFPNDPAFEEIIDWVALGLSEAPQVTNVTFCHGLAGQLEMWQMLSRKPRWKKQARWQCKRIISTLRLLSERNSNFRGWGSEDPSVFTPDLWVGFLGPAVAIAKYFIGSTSPIISLDWMERLGRVNYESNPKH